MDDDFVGTVAEHLSDFVAGQAADFLHFTGRVIGQAASDFLPIAATQRDHGAASEIAADFVNSDRQQAATAAANEQSTAALAHPRDRRLRADQGSLSCADWQS